MRIAILDYQVVPTNAIGNCDRTILNGLADEHEFVVFALEFDNPRPDRIKFVKIPAVRKPLAALFVTYHVTAPLILRRYERQHGKFDVVQSIESNTLAGDLVYAHFCHTAFLRNYWSSTKPAGRARRIARWLDHKLHAMLERVTYRKAKAIAIPSQGLGREMRSIYAAETDGKVTVISNPVDTARMARPADFDPATVRSQFGFAADDFVMTFVALGHYERKGLPLLLEAMARLQDPRVKLLVVGGQPGVIQDYTARAEALGIKGQIAFTGFQKDVRPYLWASDVFAFPSYYEVFSLVTLEAAAAGLPLVVSHLNGVEEMLVDGENGWYVERDPADIAEKIRYCAAHPEEVRRAGQAAVESVRRFDVSAFVNRWREYYAAYEQRLGHENPAGS